MTSESENQPPLTRVLSGQLVLPGGGGWLRIALAAACIATMVALWTPDLSGSQLFFQLLLMVGVGAWVVLRPGSAAPVLLLIGALSLRVFLGEPVLNGSLITLALLLPLVHQLSALSAVVPLRSNVYLSALLPTILRYLGAVLATLLGLIGSHLLGLW